VSQENEYVRQPIRWRFWMQLHPDVVSLNKDRRCERLENRFGGDPSDQGSNPTCSFSR
jgi:hypothetical protein